MQDFFTRYDALRAEVEAKGYGALSESDREWLEFAEEKVRDWSSDVDYSY